MDDNSAHPGAHGATNRVSLLSPALLNLATTVVRASPPPFRCCGRRPSNHGQHDSDPSASSSCGRSKEPLR